MSALSCGAPRLAEAPGDGVIRVEELEINPAARTIRRGMIQVRQDERHLQILALEEIGRGAPGPGACGVGAPAGPQVLKCPAPSASARLRRPPWILSYTRGSSAAPAGLQRS